MYIQKGGDT